MVDVEVGLFYLSTFEYVYRSDPIVLFFGNKEMAVLHSEGFKNPFVDKILICSAGNDFDNAAEHGDPHIAVTPLAARLEFQWAFSKKIDGLGQRPVPFIEEVFDHFRVAGSHARCVSK